MSTFLQDQQDYIIARDHRDQLLAQVADINDQLTILGKEITALHAQGVSSLDTTLVSKITQQNTLTAQLGPLIPQLNIATAQAKIKYKKVANLDPRTAITNLNDAYPFVLYPVRIETRFLTNPPKPSTNPVVLTALGNISSVLTSLSHIEPPTQFDPKTLAHIEQTISGLLQEAAKSVAAARHFTDAE